MEVTHQLAGAMIYLGKKSESIDAGVKLSKNLITNGHAWEKFLEIVGAQKGNTQILLKPENYEKPAYIEQIRSNKAGWIDSIDAFEFGTVATVTGS